MTSPLDLDAVIEAAARADYGGDWDAAPAITREVYRTSPNVRRVALAAAAETERQLREHLTRDHADGDPWRPW